MGWRLHNQDMLFCGCGNWFQGLVCVVPWNVKCGGLRVCGVSVV